MIQTRNVLWGAGVAASPLTAAVCRDRQSWTAAGGSWCGRTSRCRATRNVFAIGDLAAITDVDGQEVPGVAPAAMQMGKHVATADRARNTTTGRSLPKIARGLTTGTRDPWRPSAASGRSPGWARSASAASWRGWRGWGCTCMFLVTFRNKISVFIQWCFAYFTFQRGAGSSSPSDHRRARIVAKHV